MIAIMICKVAVVCTLYVSYVENGTLVHYYVSAIKFMVLNDEEVLNIAQSYNKCELMMCV